MIEVISVKQTNLDVSLLGFKPNKNAQFKKKEEKYPLEKKKVLAKDYTLQCKNDLNQNVFVTLFG